MPPEPRSSLLLRLAFGAPDATLPEVRLSTPADSPLPPPPCPRGALLLLCAGSVGQSH